MWKDNCEFWASEWKCGDIKIFIHRQSPKQQDEHIWFYNFWYGPDDYSGRHGEVEAYSLEDAKVAIMYEVKDNINAEIMMWNRIRQVFMDNEEW